MKIEQAIDWVACTFTSSASYPEQYDNTGQHLERGMHGYTLAYRYDDGRLELSNPVRAGMGTHVIVSGSALRECESRYGITAFEQFRWYHLNARVRRLDAAVDVRDSGLRIEELSQHLASGLCQTKAKTAPRWNDALMDGETQYVGRKTSSAYLKIYNKAAEQGIDADWIRIEATFQKRRAVPAARALAGGTSIQSLILSIADFPRHALWREIMNTRAEYVKPEQRVCGTEIWLLRTVTKTLARVSAKNPRFRAEFDRIVDLNIELLRDKS